jgi:hypothetical protein
MSVKSPTLNPFVQIEQARNGNLLAAARAEDEWQITCLYPTLQSRVTYAQESGRKALRNRFAELPLQLSTDGCDVRIPRRTVLSPAKASDLLQTF